MANAQSKVQAQLPQHTSKPQANLLRAVSQFGKVTTASQFACPPVAAGSRPRVPSGERCSHCGQPFEMRVSRTRLSYWCLACRYLVR